MYFLLGFFDLLYGDANFNIVFPIKVFVITFGLILYFSNILNIAKVNIYVHLFYILALLGVITQMYYGNNQLFFLFYTVGLVSLLSVLILLSGVNLLHSLIASFVISTAYLFLLYFKIDDHNTFYGHLFLILVVFSVVILAALLNEISNRENYTLIKQIEQNTNEKIAAKIEINKNAIVELDKLNKSNNQFQKTINALKSKERTLSNILQNKNYDNETKLKVTLNALQDFDLFIDEVNIDDVNKEIEQANIDITNKLDELKKGIETNESTDLSKNTFDLCQMLSDIMLIFKFSAEKNNFNINIISGRKVEINTDQSKLKQIFISLVNHLFKIGATKVECSYFIDDDKNITFKFNTNRYINDKLDYNNLLVPMYLSKLGGKLVEIIDEENTIAFKIPITQTKITDEPSSIINFIDKSVLIIDDDKENLSYLEFVVKDSKAKIYKATNGIEAIEIFKKHNKSIQIVVMDINMPGLNGNEAAMYMKEINPKVPILLVTAYSYNKELAVNADKVLIKPFTPKVLIDNISELVN